MDEEEDLPVLSQFPPNVLYAARALQLLASHPLTALQIPGWLERNLDAAVHYGLEQMLQEMPVEGCRTMEDVRNRILVAIEDMSSAELQHMQDLVEGSGPSL